MQFSTTPQRGCPGTTITAGPNRGALVGWCYGCTQYGRTSADPLPGQTVTFDAHGTPHCAHRTTLLPAGRDLAAVDGEGSEA